MTTLKYIHPTLKTEIVEDIDETKINIIEYTTNLHKNFLCKEICNEENCKIWIKVGEEFILAGIED